MTSCLPSCWGDCRCRSSANENTTNTTENRPSRTGSCKNCEAKNRRSGLGCRKRNDDTKTSKRNSGENQEIVGGCWSGGHGCFITCKYIYTHTHAYTTSEKPVNDQYYGLLDRYSITILCN